jgi:class 3 adenylate cyclase/HEAT repeat protein
MAQNPAPRNAAAVLTKDPKITAITLLKNFYDEEVFNLLVKEVYNADTGISEAAIRASGSLGNETAIPHLYKLIEQGKPSQRIAAIQALKAIRAPSSIGMLVKYFTHFSDEEVRGEILRAITAISPTAAQVQELSQAVYADPRQGEAVKCIAVQALVEAERYPLLKETLTKAPSRVQEAAFAKMLQSGSQEAVEFPPEALSPAALGCYLCLYTLKTKNPQANFVLEMLQKGERDTILSFLNSLSQFQGRLRFPTRVFRLLLVIPYVDAETEALVGDFMKKIVGEVKSASPQLLSEFSVITSAHLDTVFTKIRKSYISLQGITNKEVLLATLLATLLERYAAPAVLADVQAFFKEDGAGHTPPVAQMRSLMARAPKEDQNRFEACIALFTLSEKKDKLGVLSQISRVDLNRPFYTRRLNRLIRVAGALEMKTAAKKIQEILDFARSERIQFLEETSIVTLCQLLTRSIIELSREYFKEPTKNIRSLNGYIRGARFIPPKIMIGPLIHIVQHPALNPASRQLVVETLESMNLAGMQRLMPPLLKVLELKDVPEAMKLRVGDLLARYADSTFAHQALDLAAHASPVARRVAIRLLRSLAGRGTGAPVDIVTNKLYLLLEDAEHDVRVEALLALLAMSDDYAAQIVSDYIQAGDNRMITDILKGMARPLSRETFSMAVEMIKLDNQAVQEELRALLPELSQGGFAEELRQGLLSSLTVVPADGLRTDRAAVREEAPAAETESTLEQAKLEFKFKRESTQNLTVFFIDIVGYTERSTTVGMTALLKLIKAFEDIVVSTVDDCQGRIVKKMGDGILAYFKSPVAAVVAALTVQKKIQDYSAMRVELEKFQARIGLNTGDVIRKGKDILGEVVNVASRMQSAATPGDILLTEGTYQKVSEFVRCTELGRIQVKGVKEPITAYSPEELVADPTKLMDSDQEPGLQKLKESIFVPSFKIPEGKEGAGKLPPMLRQVFTEISRAIEELASDYHDEYEFKKYLQEKWNSLMESL